MTDALAGEEELPKKKSKLPLMIGLLLMLALGGGGFYAVYSGLVLTPHSGDASHGEGGPTPEPDALPAIAYVALDPLTISLNGSGARHLRFVAQLEVSQAVQNDVELLKPRVMDVLNGYLRAVNMKLLEDPAAMMRLRAQMLRRIQIVTGDGRVRDLLIIEFVLN